MEEIKTKTLKTRILLRNDIKSNWEKVKTTAVLGKGEVGIEFDPSAETLERTTRIKIGDGVTTWENLPYFEQDLTNYYTIEEVEQFVEDAIKAIPATDLSNYYTKGEVDGLLSKAQSDILALVPGVEVDKAKHAESADNADHADSADEATHAASADQATHAASADDATKLNGQEASYYATAASVGELVEIVGEKADADNVYTKSEVDDFFDAATVDADKVIFSSDLILTSTFGKYEPDASGSVTIPTATENMTLKGLLLNAFSEEKDPTIDTPTTTLTVSGGGEAEVGTTFSMPTATLKVTDVGSYTYGPATGITFAIGGLTITQDDKTTNTKSNTSAATTNDTITLTAENTKGNTYGESAISYKFNATSKYTTNPANIPLTNLGNAKEELRIGHDANAETQQAKEVTLTVSGTPKTATYTGFRKMFWGTMGSKPDSLTSAQIRALSGLQDSSKANGVKVATGEKSLSIGTGVMRVIVAVPKGRTLSKVLDANDSNANIVGSFSSMEVDVKGNNDFAATTYTVYYIDYANATTVTNTYKVTIA